MLSNGKRSEMRSLNVFSSSYLASRGPGPGVYGCPGACTSTSYVCWNASCTASTCRKMLVLSAYSATVARPP